jgi:hypothetical protein
VLEGLKAIADDPDAKHSDKIRALELLGKRLRLFTEQSEEDQKITVTIHRVGS